MNIVLVFYDILKYINDEQKHLKFRELLNLFNNDDSIFTLVDFESTNLERIALSQKRCQDDTSMQIYFNSDFEENGYNVFIEYINSLKELYNINHIYFVDNVKNLKELIEILNESSFEIASQYNNSQFKLIKKQYSLL